MTERKEIDEIPDEKILEELFICDRKIDALDRRLAAIRDEFNARPDVIDINIQANDLKTLRMQLEGRALSLDLHQQGRYSFIRRTHTVRTILPYEIARKYGFDFFCKIATVKVKDAEEAVARLMEEQNGKKITKADVKAQLEDCCRTVEELRKTEVHLDTLEDL